MFKSPPGGAGDPRQSARRLAWPLFLALAAFYLLGTGGTINTPDGVLMFRVTRSLVEDRTWAIATLAEAPGWGGLNVPDAATGETRFYAKYGPGLPLCAVPAYLAGGVLAPLALAGEKGLLDVPAGKRRSWYDVSPSNFEEAFRAFAVSWTNSAVMAVTVAGVFLIGLELGFGLLPSLLAGLVGAIATPLWPYSKTFFAEPLGGLGLTWFFYFILRGRGAGPLRWRWLLAGLFLGLGVLAKPSHLVLLLPAALLVAGYARRLPGREAAGRVITFAAGVLPGITLIAVRNHLCFGAWWETGYGDEIRQWTTPLWEGMAGLLVSPGRGLLLYFPIWILVAAASRRFTSSHRLESLFIAGCPAVLLVLHARWHSWEGGWCWGPRFLLPAIPLLLIPLASLFRDLPRSRAARLAVAGVVVLGFLVAFSGAWVDFNDFHEWLHGTFEAHRAAFQERGIATSTELYRWSWAYSPLARTWTFPAKDYFLLPRAIREPGLILALFGVWTAVLLFQGFRLIRRVGGG